MNLRRYMCFILGMVISYGAALTIPVILDFIFDTKVETSVIIWLNTGLIVMKLRKIAFPMPDMSKIDVLGGLNMLWWALFWPRYLFNN